VIALGLGGAAPALVLAARAESAVALGIGLAVAGGLSASAIAASGRAVMGWFARDQRGLALGLRQMAVPLGAAAAAVALPAAAAASGTGGALLALAAAASVAALLALVFLRPPPVAAPARLAGLPPPLRDGKQWHLSLASGLMLWAQVALSAFFMVILTESHGFAAATAAALFGLVHVVSGVARIGIGLLSDRTGRRLPFLRLNALALAAALAACALAAGGGAVPAAVLLIAATILAYTWNGLAFTAVAEMAGHARSGTALGLHGTLMRLLSAPAGLGIGAAAAWGSWALAFALLALLALVAAAMLARLLAEEERRRAH
jgi:sugar phosphate permease